MMVGFTAEDIRIMTARAAEAMPGLEQQLNAADAKLGDGDTGRMLRRVLGSLAERARSTADDDVGKVFGALTQAAASSTGSSLGTLLMVALMTFSKATAGRHQVGWAELGDLMDSARLAMSTRGKAQLGDKTVLDSIDAVARAVKGCSTREEVVGAARAAAVDVSAAFKDKENKVGRARMFSGATVGLDDPGMLAFSLLLEAVTN
jgi:dihydroxyacetone kinase-like protein